MSTEKVKVVIEGYLVEIERKTLHKLNHYLEESNYSSYNNELCHILNSMQENDKQFTEVFELKLF